MDAAEARPDDPLGKIFDLTATILKGPNSAFRRQQMKLTEALDTARLYLLNDGNPRRPGAGAIHSRARGSTGQDACYFYNRVEGAEARWVSYHFHPEPELVLPDDDIAELLATLTRTRPQAECAPRKYR